MQGTVPRDAQDTERIRNAADHLTNKASRALRTTDPLHVKLAGCWFSEGIDLLSSRITKSHTLNKVPLKGVVVREHYLQGSERRMRCSPFSGHA